VYCRRAVPRSPRSTATVTPAPEARIALGET
jgi:hypothetical protein